MLHLRAALLAAALLVTAACSFAIAQPQTTSSAGMTLVATIPLPGPAVRFDYQSFNPSTGLLYISHMSANHLVVFNVRTRKVVANLSGFPSVHGVFVVPSLHRVYASATGIHQVIALNTRNLKITGHAGPVDYPDGIAYAPRPNRVFVSDEHGAVDAVIDARTNRLIKKIPLGGGAGNTVYDPRTGNILVAVHHLDQLVTIDPARAVITHRLSLPGIADPHGIALDNAAHLAFIAGEANHSLAVVNLTTMKILGKYQLGDDPDVLAYDPGLQRLYVAAESGTVAIFHLAGTKLTRIGTLQMPHAHTVSVDPSTHLVYFPLQNINGHPELRIFQPSAHF
ncbi:MAG: YncE family protein [Acidobacteriaceae bacterium]